jgi:eukaryotic-like serine/threonine-protein kinase
LRTHRPDIPAALEMVVLSCLRRDPSQRYADVAELARALAPFGPPRADVSVERIEHVLGVSGVAASTTSGIPPTFAPSDPATLQPTTTSATRQKAGLLVIPAIVLAVGMTAAIFFGLRSRKASAPLPAAPVATASAPSPTSSASGAPVDSSLAASSAQLVALEPSAVAPAPPPVHGAPGPGAPPRPASSATVPAATASARPCRTVKYYDADGNTLFRKDCSP